MGANVPEFGIHQEWVSADGSLVLVTSHIFFCQFTFDFCGWGNGVRFGQIAPECILRFIKKRKRYFLPQL